MPQSDAAPQQKCAAFPIATFNMSASAAFTIVGHLLRGWPEDIDRVPVRLEDSQGALHHKVYFGSPDAPAPYGGFNLSSGVFHPHQPSKSADEGIGAWPAPNNFVSAVLSKACGLEQAVEDVFAALGLTPAAKPNPWLGTTELAIGALFARFLYEPSILIENGWVQGGRYSEWLKDLPEECMMAPPYSDSSAATAWRLRWDAPADGGGVVFIDADIAYLDGTDQSFEIPTELQKPECSLHMVVDRLERHLRGTKTSGK